jgi:glyoxylase-like metal-dependent hydrolase (beta-lactamase superfamily II)
VIDSVIDFDIATGTLWYESVDNITEYLEKESLTVEWLLETHMHADHLSAATYLKEKVGGTTAIGKHITDIQGLYQETFGVSEAALKEAAKTFDHLWEEEESFTLGSIDAFTYYAPGHTPADIVYVIGDAAFVGDSLFMPDFGSARCDFPGGSAADMYDAVQRIYSMPDSTRLFMCHDYLPPSGRTEYRHETTVGEEKADNIHLRAGTAKESFVKVREERDATLSLPQYMIPSLQVNIQAGKISQIDGRPMLRWPINSVFSTYPKDTQ